MMQRQKLDVGLDVGLDVKIEKPLFAQTLHCILCISMLINGVLPFPE